MKKKNNILGIILTALFLAACFAVGYLLGPYIEEFLEGEGSVAEKLLHVGLLVLLFYVAFMLQLIIHEAGHLVFGLLSGYRFSSFRIFSLMLVRGEGGRLTLKRLSIAGTGGQCLMAPPELRDGRMPVVLYNLGGSLMNLITAAAAFGLFILADGIDYLSHALLFLALTGAATALINGIPLRLGIINNDGSNAVEVCRSPAAMRAFWVQMKVNELQAGGTRVKNMPSEWFELPSEEELKSPIVATVAVFAYNRLFDEGKFRDADALAARLISGESGIVGLHRALMLCDRAYLEMIGSCRPEVIDSYLTKEVRGVMRAMRTFPSVIRTEYAHALLRRGDGAAAKAQLAALKRVAKSYPYAQDIEAEMELIRLADERKSSGVSLLENREK